MYLTMSSSMWITLHQLRGVMHLHQDKDSLYNRSSGARTAGSGRGPKNNQF